MSIWWQKPGGDFETTVPTTLADAVALASSTTHVDTGNFYFGVNPVEVPAGYHRRGCDEHVSRCAALYPDVDIKTGGVSDSEVADTVAEGIAAALGQPPAAGGVLQPRRAPVLDAGPRR